MVNIDQARFELRQGAKTADLGGGERLNVELGTPGSTREYVL